MPASHEAHRAQIEAILSAWGMPSDGASRAAEIMAWADLHGIDNHGLSMLTVYDARRRQGRLRMEASPALARETPVSALVDGGGGLGRPAAHLAMATAIHKARAGGIGVVALRNSSHSGACGYYTGMAATAGLVGMAATSASGIRVAPTGGSKPGSAPTRDPSRRRGARASRSSSTWPPPRSRRAASATGRTRARPVRPAGS